MAQVSIILPKWAASTCDQLLLLSASMYSEYNPPLIFWNSLMSVYVVFAFPLLSVFPPKSFCGETRECFVWEYLPQRLVYIYSRFQNISCTFDLSNLLTISPKKVVQSFCACLWLCDLVQKIWYMYICMNNHTCHIIMSVQCRYMCITISYLLILYTCDPFLCFPHIGKRATSVS